MYSAKSVAPHRNKSSFSVLKIGFLLFLLLAALPLTCLSAEPNIPDANAFAELQAKTAKKVAFAYGQSRFSALSRDYFSRFSRDPNAQPAKDEVLIDNNWKIVYQLEASHLTKLMAGYLVDFLNRPMSLRIAPPRPALYEERLRPAIILNEFGGGEPNTPESFTIIVKPKVIQVNGYDKAGLRAGIVKLADLMAFRQAPILKRGSQTFQPRVAMRAGVIPWMGTYRDLVFLGYNAAILTANRYYPSYGKVHAKEFSLFTLSKSDAIAELKKRQDPAAIERLVDTALDAKRHGLKVYCFLNTEEKFPKYDPIFKAHPDIIGTKTWHENGYYNLCTESPLVKQYLTESIKGIFESIPGLDGVAIIVGAESFYHCYTFPYGAKPGHTTCPRCEAMGAEKVVSDLVHLLRDAARQVNPNAEIMAWPYQAFPWSADPCQVAFIKKLTPGTAILTDVANRETIEKPEGVKKVVEDYSIDLIEPGKRPMLQIETCHQQGIHAYLKTEPELAFEIPGVDHVPSLDRWVDRAESMASSGADGVLVFPYFKPFFAASTAEIGKFTWWQPTTGKEQLLEQLAARIAGHKAGPHLRNAWKHVSDAIPWSPEIFLPHYMGPYYLGAAHPMCADPNAELPKVFYGQFLFHWGISYADAIKLKPTFLTSPSGNVPVFGRFYRKMEEHLKKAVKEVSAAEPLVPNRCKLAFDAEDYPIRWFYHTARSQANFYESCQLRNKLLDLAVKQSRSQEEVAEAKQTYSRWREVLLDEKANAEEALPIIKADIRLDFSLDDTVKFSPTAVMIIAKLQLINSEINEFLPSIAKKCGFEP